jgi:nicotinamidase-related amidase
MAPGVITVTIEEGHGTTAIETIQCTPTIAFGGNDQWLYLSNIKKFDLSRGAERKLVIESDEKLGDHSGFMIDPARTALVVVDMQNYFIHPTYRHHTAGINAVEPTLKAIEKCRREGIQVAWLNWGLGEHDLQRQPPTVQRGLRKSLGWHISFGAELPDGQGRCLFKNSWNAELYPPLKATVESADLFFDKHQMGGLWSAEEPFHQYLQDSGTKTLLFAGVDTHQCVMGTLRDAYALGYDCVLLGDCTGTMTGEGAQERCGYNIATNLGFVTDSKAFHDAQVYTGDSSFLWCIV